MTKEELARKKGQTYKQDAKKSPSEALLTNNANQTQPNKTNTGNSSKSPKSKSGSSTKTEKSSVETSKAANNKKNTPSIKATKTVTEKSTAKNSNDETPKKKRGRKEGTVLVDPEDRKKNVSISVDPKDLKIYKRVISKNSKRFKSMSQLVEQALDYFIKNDNTLN